MNNATRQRNRNTIEQAAIECFSSHSFTFVTVEEIARKAGVTKKTIYNYYPSKAALFASIFEKNLEELYRQELNALDACSSLREAVSTQFTVLNSFTNENRQFMQMFWTLKDSINDKDIPPDILKRILRLNKDLIDMPAAHIAKYPLTGAFSNYSPEDIIHYISAVNKGLFLQCDKADKLGLLQGHGGNLSSISLACLLAALDSN